MLFYIKWAKEGIFNVVTIWLYSRKEDVNYLPHPIYGIHFRWILGVNNFYYDWMKIWENIFTILEFNLGDAPHLKDIRKKVKFDYIRRLFLSDQSKHKVKHYV